MNFDGSTLLFILTIGLLGYGLLDERRRSARRLRTIGRIKRDNAALLERAECAELAAQGRTKLAARLIHSGAQNGQKPTKTHQNPPKRRGSQSAKGRW